jgi:hypothetical protein
MVDDLVATEIAILSILHGRSEDHLHVFPGHLRRIEWSARKGKSRAGEVLRKGVRI